MSDANLAIKELANNLSTVNNHNRRLIEAVQALAALVTSLEQRVVILEKNS